MADGTLDLQLTENLNMSKKSNTPHHRASLHENLEPSDMLLEELRKKNHSKKFKKSRRQSDTVLNLSGKSFRKRTSIIIQNFMSYNGAVRNTGMVELVLLDYRYVISYTVLFVVSKVGP